MAIPLGNDNPEGSVWCLSLPVVRCFRHDVEIDPAGAHHDNGFAIKRFTNRS